MTKIMTLISLLTAIGLLGCAPQDSGASQPNEDARVAEIEANYNPAITDQGGFRYTYEETLLVRLRDGMKGQVIAHIDFTKQSVDLTYLSRVDRAYGEDMWREYILFKLRDTLQRTCVKLLSTETDQEVLAEVEETLRTELFPAMGCTVDSFRCELQLL